MIESNSIRRYTLYAIGEITLVVIGILIALQINNWNEGRKDRAFEQNMLSQLEQSLNNQLERYNRSLKSVDSKRDALLYIYKNKSEVDHIPDSIFADKASGFSLTVTILTDAGAYEALKVSGLDKIENDSLRLMITRYYEVTLHYYEEGLERINDGQDFGSFMKEMERKGIVDLSLSINESDEFIWTTRFDWNGLLREEEFFDHLDYEAARERSTRDLLKDYVDATETLLDVIQDHIKS